MEGNGGKGRQRGKEGKGKREGKREVKEKIIGREKGRIKLKLKNGRVGKQIKLVATLYTPLTFPPEHSLIV